MEEVSWNQASVPVAEPAQLMTHDQLKRELIQRRKKEFNRNRKGAPDLVCGIFSSVVATTLTHPFDFLKTAFQLRLTGHNFGPPAKNQFKSYYELIKVVFTERNIPGLMYGAKVSSISRILSIFMRNEFFRMSFKDRHLQPRKVQLPGQMAVGFACGVCEGAIIKSTFDSVKVLMIADSLAPKPQYEKFIPVFKELYNEHVWSLFRAPAACCILQGYTTMIRFGLYGSFKKMISGNARDAPVWHTFLVGGMTYTVSSLMTQPFDVIKTQMQAIQTLDGLKETTFLSVGRRIGINWTLWTGIWPRIVRGWVIGPVTFYTFEKTLTTFAS